jgi:2'-5' RNA ligase
MTKAMEKHDDGTKKRLFVAIKIPQEFQSQVLQLFKEESPEGVCWQSGIKLHITLFFIGDQSQEGTLHVVELLSKIKNKSELFQFQLKMKGIVRCQSRTLRIVFEESSGLDVLENEIQVALQPLGISYNFSGGHATLAKLSEVPEDWIEQYINNHSPFSITLPSFTVEEFVLCESNLKTGEYLVKHTFSLPRFNSNFEVLEQIT